MSAFLVYGRKSNFLVSEWRQNGYKVVTEWYQSVNKMVAKPPKRQIYMGYGTWPFWAARHQQALKSIWCHFGDKGYLRQLDFLIIR